MASYALTAEFIQFIDHVADTSTDADAVRMTVLRAVRLVGSIGNVRGKTFDRMRDNAVRYGSAAYADRAMVRALNAAPGSYGDKLESLKDAARDLAVAREAARLTLWTALSDVRPSLALTGCGSSDDDEVVHELACMRDRLHGRDGTDAAPSMHDEDRESAAEHAARMLDRD